MINVNLTVREAVNLASNCGDVGLIEKIVAGIEQALRVGMGRTVTITGGITMDNRISCIKAIRLATLMGLKESMDWVDVVRGRLSEGGGNIVHGKSNSVSLKDATAAQQLLSELTSLGCQGYLT